MLSKVEIRNPASPRLPSSLRFAETRRRDKSAIGFTLVELLVVIAIIVLLVGILAPSIGMAIKKAANVHTIARVAELSGGCNIYHNQNDYYPGQRYSDQLKGSSPAGTFNGSQWLAKALFSDPDATPTFPHPKYAPLKESEDLVDPKQDSVGTISDRNTSGRGPMPILYYPARLGESGLDQYKSGDNSDYISGHTGPESKTFREFITDNRFGQSDMPYSPKKFLIIAAGMDRLYFTDDDICYPTFSGD